MSKAEKASEPTMDEILASIRKIIAEEPVGKTAAAKTEPSLDEAGQGEASKGLAAPRASLDDILGMVDAPAKLVPEPAATGEADKGGLSLPFPAPMAKTAGAPEPEKPAASETRPFFPTPAVAKPAATSIPTPGTMPASPRPDPQPLDFGAIVPHKGPEPLTGGEASDRIPLPGRFPEWLGRPGGAPAAPEPAPASASGAVGIAAPAPESKSASAPSTPASASAAAASPVSLEPAAKTPTQTATAPVAAAPVSAPVTIPAAALATASAANGKPSPLPAAGSMSKPEPAADKPAAPGAAQQTPAPKAAANGATNGLTGSAAAFGAAAAPIVDAKPATVAAGASPSATASAATTAAKPAMSAPVAASTSVPKPLAGDGQPAPIAGKNATASGIISTGPSSADPMPAASAAKPPVSPAVPASPPKSASVPVSVPVPSPVPVVEPPVAMSKPAVLDKSPAARPTQTGELVASPPPIGGVRTLDDTIIELLRPMIRQWLDDNMPRMVEKALRVELAASLEARATPPGKAESSKH
jgi:cell pole-organizing protein PopZ